MSEIQKYNNALIVVGKPPATTGSHWNCEDFDPEAAGKILELVANGDSLLKICKMPDFPTLLTVRMWEFKEAEFGRQLRVASTLRGRYQYEKRAALLRELEGEIWKKDEKDRAYMDLAALDKYMKHSEKFSMVSDREQDLTLRRAEESRVKKDVNTGGPSGDVPTVQVKNPFANEKEVDLEQYRVENFDNLEGGEE